MKVFTGKVTSNKMAKTLTVVVERVVVHPLYKKRFKKIKKYLVHSENPVEVGERIKFAASKPFSKLKKWKVLEVKGEKKAEAPEKTETVKVKKTVKKVAAKVSKKGKAKK